MDPNFSTASIGSTENVASDNDQKLRDVLRLKILQVLWKKAVLKHFSLVQSCISALYIWNGIFHPEPTASNFFCNYIGIYQCDRDFVNKHHIQGGGICFAINSPHSSVNLNLKNSIDLLQLFSITILDAKISLYT